jgi:hypothetical protein
MKPVQFVSRLGRRHRAVDFGLPSRDLDHPSGHDWVLTSLPLYKPETRFKFKIIRVSIAGGLIPPAERSILAVVSDSHGRTIEKLAMEGPVRHGFAA